MDLVSKRLRRVRTLLAVVVAVAAATAAGAATAAAVAAAPAAAAVADMPDGSTTLPSETLRRETVRPKPAIVDGVQIPITRAPWQVFLAARTASGATVQCGGSIRDATTVVTAGHCVHDPGTARRFPATAMTVVAGVSNYATPRAGDVRQTRAVVGVDAHPYYVFDPTSGGVAPDDVATLRLATPLDLGGATAKAIPPAAGGPLPAPGTPAFISGFGREVVGAPPDGNLYGLDTTIGDPLLCGGEATAVVLCVQSPRGSACEGDSGGPLTVGTPAALTGVASFVTLNGPTGECGVGSVNGYTNIAAPEIEAFLEGETRPPRAPRGGGDVSARGIFEVGQSMTCNPGTWSDSPTFAFTFIDTRNGAVLQSGASPSYAFGAVDVGRTVACSVAASNAGGTGISRTQPSPAVIAAPAPQPQPQPRPPPQPAQPAVRIGVRAAHARGVPGGSMRYTIRVVNRGAAAARGVVVCDAPGSGLAFATRPKGARAIGRRACWRIGTLRARTGRTLRVTLRIARTRTRTARTLVNVGAVDGSNIGRRTDTARIRVRGAPHRVHARR